MKSISFIVLLVALVEAVVQPTSEELEKFETWAQTHNRTYASEEEKTNRRLVFVGVDRMIEAHNANKTSTFKMGHNSRSDWTDSEWKRLFNPIKDTVKDGKKGGRFLGPQSIVDVSSEVKETRALSTPNSVDWRTTGCVTSVKNQEQCGDCWSFSVAGAVEGAVCVATGSAAVSLSAQELTSCVTENDGCQGGAFQYGFDWVEAHGLCSTAEYPYEAINGTCTSCGPVAFIRSYNSVAASNSALMEAISQQPVALGIAGYSPGFNFYQSGIFSGDCGTYLDHAVLGVGYNYTTTGESYYIIKNSWGTSWGEEGYMQLEMDNSNNGEGECGILKDNWYAVGKTGVSSSGAHHYTAMGVGLLLSLTLLL